MTRREPTITEALTLWDLGVVTSDDVVAWADRRILALDPPPHDLIELSAEGPDACLGVHGDSFPARPLPLSYQEAFAIKASLLDLGSDEAVLAFALWAGRSQRQGAMDTDLFLTQHELHEACKAETLESTRDLLWIVRTDLPGLLPRCAEIARRLIDDGSAPPRSLADLVDAITCPGTP